MSPAHSHVEQSRNTLAFATRAKEVTNTTHINMVRSLRSHVPSCCIRCTCRFQRIITRVQKINDALQCPLDFNTRVRFKTYALHSFLHLRTEWCLATLCQVVSDKVLVKQLQKEVARLEAELKVPDLASEAASSEALLQAKDLQIQKVCTFLPGPSSREFVFQPSKKSLRQSKVLSLVVSQMEEELRALQVQRDAAQARLDEVSRKLEAEEVAKKLAEEAAKRLAEEAAKRPVRTLHFEPPSVEVVMKCILVSQRLYIPTEVHVQATV
jgi:hypothetical protein